MSITITDDLAGEFGRVGEPVEVRAPDGRVLGTFTPRPPEPYISEEEMQRLEDPNTGKWYPAAEVEAKLRGTAMFTVIWRDSPLDALADAFVVADLPTRDAIERAVTRLNNRLAADPNALGESRPGRGRRIAYEAPCAINFTVDDATNTVRVTRFWTY